MRDTRPDPHDLYGGDFGLPRLPWWGLPAIPLLLLTIGALYRLLS